MHVPIYLIQLVALKGINSSIRRFPTKLIKQWPD